VPVRPWCLSVFFDAKELREHYAANTFGKRLGWPRPLARFVAALFARPVSGIFRSMGAIRVYRNANPALVRRTFSESLNALLNDENLIIYPDVSYDSDEEQIGEMYRGFLLLERAYYSKKGTHLPFVPLFYSRRSREIRMGDAILFPDGDFIEHMSGVYKRITEAINELSR